MLSRISLMMVQKQLETERMKASQAESLVEEITTLKVSLHVMLDTVLGRMTCSGTCTAR